MPVLFILFSTISILERKERKGNNLYFTYGQHHTVEFLIKKKRESECMSPGSHDSAKMTG